ncbi:MAG: hypothetical protein RL432_616, partial [Bacteroidota bacterium]
MKTRFIIPSVAFFYFSLTVCAQTKLTASEKTNFTRFLNKGVEYFQAERSNDALESLKKAEALDPEN